MNSSAPARVAIDALCAGAGVVPMAERQRLFREHRRANQKQEGGEAPAPSVVYSRQVDTEFTRAGELFRPHPNLSDSVNRRVVRSEVDGGVDLRILQAGAELELETENRFYTLIYCGCERAWLSGHPQFCPAPVLVKIHGSTWGGSMIRTGFIGRGMHLEFDHPQFRTILTSRIVEIKEVRT